MRSLFAFALVCSLAACNGSPGSPIPGPGRALMDAVPGETAGAVPGETAGAVPGETAGAVPGASLACNDVFEADRANCTLAINVNVPALSNSNAPASLISGLHPADIQSRYALPAGNPGATVAVVDAYDDPAAEADLAVYRTTFGLPQCTGANGCFKKVDQRGTTAYPAVNAAWAEEISLDLDMVSAACPNCKILLVEADSASFDDLGAGVDLAAASGAKAISNSYYGPEWSGETAYDAHYNHPGAAVTVSAGDERSPFYPAASPYVTSVGGTTLSGSSGSWKETAWSYGGAGCSAYETKPAWQGKNGCKGMRSTVDVAAVADPQTGVSMFDAAAGGWYVAGGTSASAPIVAAAYALSGNAQGPAYSYAHPGGFFDVAPAGYDPFTGLGSPDGLAGL